MPNIGITNFDLEKKVSNYFPNIKIKSCNDANAAALGNDYECDYKAAKSLGLKAIYIHSNLTPKDQPKLGLQGFNWKKVYDEINNLL